MVLILGDGCEPNDLVIVIAQRPGMPNQALEQTRDSVLRCGEIVGCELLNLIVRRVFIN